MFELLPQIKNVPFTSQIKIHLLFLPDRNIDSVYFVIFYTNSYYHLPQDLVSFVRQQAEINERHVVINKQLQEETGVSLN